MIFDWKNGLIWISINIEYEGKNTKINNCILDTGSATFKSSLLLNDYMELGTHSRSRFSKS